MKDIARFLAFGFAVLVFLVGCSRNNVKTLGLEEAKTRYQTNNEILGFLSIAEEVQKFCAKEYGIALKKDTVRFMPGSEQALVWELTAIRPMSLIVEIREFFPAEETARVKKAALEKKGKEVHIAPYNPPTIGGKAAPLMETWGSWNYERKVERVMQLLMYQFVSKTLKRPDAEPLSRFLAEKATEEYLLATLGGASPVLAKYISEQRDEKTFASLFPDCAERVYNLYGNKDPGISDEALETSRAQLLKVWLAEYKKRYTERFLTNRYADFGNKIPEDGEIIYLQRQIEALGNWKQYQGEFRRAGESVAEYLKQLH